MLEGNRSRSVSPRPPSLADRLEEYAGYHPVVRWLRRYSVLIAIVFLMCAALASMFYIAIKFAERYAAAPTLGAVASEDKLCSQIGIDLLKAGGNAADAMVGTKFCVGVVGMYHSGIGGGGFALIRGPNGLLETVDFRETAPAAAWEGMYEGNVNGSLSGGLASGVPGELRGLEYIHTKYGKLSWPTVIIPAIRLAREGFKITKDVNRYMQATYARDTFLTDDPSWAIEFAPNGTLLGLGDTLIRTRYAETLQEIASNGADVFYQGPIAMATVTALAASNGSMTLQDLADYQVTIRPAVMIEYRDFYVYGCPSPASGAVALSALKTVEGYHDMGRPEALNISTHRLDEALRFAYASRAELGDPGFIPRAMDLEIDMLLPASAEARRANISDDHTFDIPYYNPSGYAQTTGHGTSHLIAADNSGLAISLTSTVNHIFGNQIIVPGTGVVMNNEMNDFSIPGVSNEFGYPPAPSNFIRPGKRPMSSMTPILVEHKANRTLYYGTGAAGGSRIISAVVQLLWATLDRGLDAKSSLEAPRFHDQLIPDRTEFEWALNETDKNNQPSNERILFNSVDELPLDNGEGFRIQREESGIGTGYAEGFDNRTVAFMAGRGHNIKWVSPGYSAAQAVRLMWNGSWEAAGEPRQADSMGLAT